MDKLIFEYKAKSGDNGTLAGYAAVTGNIDRVGDIIERGAFANLDDFVQKGFAAFGHSWDDEPVGFITKAYEDENGLFVEMSFHSTDEAQKCRTVVNERIAAGKFVGLSIGYRTIESSWETRESEDVRVLKKIEVYEFSIVTVPANPKAQVTAVKNDLAQSGSPAGLTFAQHFESALAAVSEVTKRFESYISLKQEEGRKANPERVAEAKELSEALSALVAGCEAKQADEQPDAALIHQIKMMEVQARQSGLIQ